MTLKMVHIKKKNNLKIFFLPEEANLFSCVLISLPGGHGGLQNDV